MINSATPFRSIGDAPAAAWEQMAAKYRSPIPNDQLADCAMAATGYGCVALAQAIKESQLGAAGLPIAKRNPLGLMDQTGSSFLSFSTWAEAFAEFRRRMTDPSYKGGVYLPQDKSLRDYIVTYVGGPGCLQSNGARCANGETWDGDDGGSIGLYIQQTIDRINGFKEMTVTDPTPVRTNPFPVPPLYSLSKDYARYGISQSAANKIAGHRFQNRNGFKPLAIVLHIQEGTNASSLSWWASGNADASSSVMIGRDGSVLSIIPPEHGPWTNGDTQRPSPRGQALLDRIKGANPNLVTLSIEAEGYYQQEATDAQLQAICWQVTEWMLRYDLTDVNVYRHADINSVTRANCPGAYYDDVLANLRGTGIAKPTFTNLPQDMISDDIYQLFPEASPNGPVTQKWMARCLNTKLWPQRVSVSTPAPGSRPWSKRFVFSDGWIIYADANGRIWTS